LVREAPGPTPATKLKHRPVRCRASVVGRFHRRQPGARPISRWPIVAPLQQTSALIAMPITVSRRRCFGDHGELEANRYDSDGTSGRAFHASSRTAQSGSSRLTFGMTFRSSNAEFQLRFFWMAAGGVDRMRTCALWCSGRRLSWSISLSRNGHVDAFSASARPGISIAVDRGVGNPASSSDIR